MRIGVISDTHGLLRREAVEALRGVQHVLHAGDVGKPDILTALQAIAPVTAVRGNVDHGPWADALAHDAWVRLEGRTIYMVHRPEDVTVDPEAAGVDVVVCGHTHVPRIERRGDLLLLNPGSAGPRRFDKPVSLAILTLTPTPSATLVTLVV